MVGLRFVSSSLRRIVKVLLKSEHFPNLKPFFFKITDQTSWRVQACPPIERWPPFLFQDQIFQKRSPSKSHKIILPNICLYISIFFLVFFLFILEIDGRFLYVIITNDPQVTTGNRSSLAWAWHRWNERVSRGHQVRDIRGQQGDTRVI